ncbi:MAG TPA: hypothetical protein VF421_02310 [Niabella sp.]
MNRIILSILLSFSLSGLYAQKVQEIYVHLYTDSLKKGTYNYINIDGKMTDGSWMPLTAKEITFTSDYGKFEGNSLVLPDEPTVKKVAITASLKTNTKLSRQFTIWIKQKPDPLLPDNAEDRHRNQRRQ